MKKLLIICLGLFVILSFILTGYLGEETATDKSETYNNLLRFHVIANSDSETDQNLKRDVRDRILEEFGHILAESDNISQTKTMVLENLAEIEEAARGEVVRQGFSYPVKAMLGEFDFPVKSYGSLILPAGRYEALRIVVGAGKGQNWWCVLFPPLCFVDISSNVASGLPESALPAITGQRQSQKLRVKFKVLELLYGNKGDSRLGENDNKRLKKQAN